MAARRLPSTPGLPGAPEWMPARLHIDWTRCDGRGLCTELLAEQLTRDEWGYPLARRAAQPTSWPVAGEPTIAADDPSNVVIPASQLAAATDAVALCPRQALRLIDG